MINLDDFTKSLSQLIGEKTGIYAVSDKAFVKDDMNYVVSCEDLSMTLIDGGRQVERQVFVGIACYSNKKLKGEKHVMVQKIFDNLFPYFTICQRHFNPTQARCRDENGFMKIEFEIFFCDLLSRDEVFYDLISDVEIDINNLIKMEDKWDYQQ